MTSSHAWCIICGIVRHRGGDADDSDDDDDDDAAAALVGGIVRYDTVTDADVDVSVCRGVVGPSRRSFLDGGGKYVCCT